MKVVPKPSAVEHDTIAAPAAAQRRSFKPIPIRYLLPNLITLIALCSGITAIRFAVEGHYESAVTGVIFAIVLDALDGRLARYLKGTSRFGAELDSLADFVNFGVAPAILVYFWSLNSLRTFGWVVSLMLAIGCALRLARFNVALDDPARPAWMSGFFTGMPAPAGALLALVPLYLGFLNIIDEGHPFARIVSVYEIIIAVLLISRIPTYSGKNIARVPSEYALPILALMAAFAIFLFYYPWEVLALLSAVYMVLIPVSALAYHRYKKSGRF